MRQYISQEKMETTLERLNAKMDRETLHLPLGKPGGLLGGALVPVITSKDAGEVPCRE